MLGEGRHKEVTAPSHLYLSHGLKVGHSIKCYRMQLPEANPFYAAKKSKKGKVVSYLPTERTRTARSITSDGEGTKTSKKKHVFPEHELLSELLSDLQADEEAEEAQKPPAEETQMMHHLEHKDLTSGFTEQDAMTPTFQDAEQYEPALFKDKQFMKFSKAVEAFPDQVLRYATHSGPSEPKATPRRVEEEDLDAEEEEEEEILTGKGDKIDTRGVLWISTKEQLEDSAVPTCPNCQSARLFEFQVY